MVYRGKEVFYYDEDGYPGFTIKLTDTNIWDGIIVIEREEFINGK